jgi:hypothetical protein
VWKTQRFMMDRASYPRSNISQLSGSRWIGNVFWWLKDGRHGTNGSSLSKKTNIVKG